jgi:hypothetical protein
MKESAGDSRTVDAFDLLVCESVAATSHVYFRCLASESSLVAAPVRIGMMSF